MGRWRVDDLLILAEVLAACDLNSFTVRRTFARLEGGEITPLQAAKIIGERLLYTRKQPLE